MANKKYDMVITGGRVIDPALGFGKDAYVFIKDGLIAKIVTPSAAVSKEVKALDEDQVINADGKLVVPGLIDIHVHLREPGREGRRNRRIRLQGRGGRRVYVDLLHAQHDARVSTTRKR